LGRRLLAPGAPDWHGVLLHAFPKRIIDSMIWHDACQACPLGYCRAASATLVQELRRTEVRQECIWRVPGLAAVGRCQRQRTAGVMERRCRGRGVLLVKPVDARLCDPQCLHHPLRACRKASLMRLHRMPNSPRRGSYVNTWESWRPRAFGGVKLIPFGIEGDDLLVRY